MSTAQVPPTPENVAETLTDSDNDFHDGNGWHQSLTATGNVVSIEVEPLDADGDPVDTVHFRAVVAAVSEDAMLDGPLDIIGTPGGRVLLAHDSLMDLSPEQAYAAAAQLIASAALAAEVAKGFGPSADERLVDGPNGGC